MKMCDVSVVIPNFNRTSLLDRALRSIAMQELLPRDVIIVDDCSDQKYFSDIITIIKAYEGKINVRLVRNEFNKGANYCRNIGIYESSSKFIAFLDSDDIWMPDKLKIQMDEIKKAKSSDSRPVFSATARYRVDAGGDIIAYQFGGKLLDRFKIRRSNFIGTLSSIVVETWVARHVHGFNETLPACQDWDFFIRLADYVQYVGVPQPLCVYVDHDEDRITLNNGKRLRGHLFIYKNHIKPNLKLGQNASHEFYRNIAEDYQALGKLIKSRRFYVKSRSLFHGRKSKFKKYIYLFYVSIISLFIRADKIGSIKEKRYNKYSGIMGKFLNNKGLSMSYERDCLFVKHAIIS